MDLLEARATAQNRPLWRIIAKHGATPRSGARYTYYYYHYSRDLSANCGLTYQPPQPRLSQRIRKGKEEDHSIINIIILL